MKVHQYILDQKLTEEILKSIKGLKLNKIHGHNDFTVEYYKQMAHILVPPLTKACNHVRETGQLPPSWSQATVMVITKEGRDHISLKSYRPISLLNVDFKILASSLAYRLNTFIGNYISQDQVGFIPNREPVTTQLNFYMSYLIEFKIRKKQLP